MDKQGDLVSLVAALEKSAKNPVKSELLWNGVKGSIQPLTFINNLSEVMRCSREETEELLRANGFSDFVAQARMSASGGGQGGAGQSVQVTQQPVDSPFGDLFRVQTAPEGAAAVEVSQGVADALAGLNSDLVPALSKDPFLNLYRKDVCAYHDSFVQGDGKRMMAYVEETFGGAPKYVVNSGIGANEQFNHFVAGLHNASAGKKCEWLVLNSPKQLEKLPAGATLDNTLFLEFSRSGKTEETLKIHEYTPREAKRVVFANSGPLREIGERDGNLILELPSEVSGRFGRNKTPILMAPMMVCGMDTAAFWADIAKAVEAYDLSDPESLPVQLAKFIWLHQLNNGINHIYVGCDDDEYKILVDEFTQYWNEGVNKNKNDLSMSRYLGLPRDSHMTIEGILGNHDSKMAFFVFRERTGGKPKHPMIREDIDPINNAHAGLKFGQEEGILAEANFLRFSEVMPCVKMTLCGETSLRHAAIISQLWADITFCYSRFKAIDPGSNPEVKFVRERSAALLAEAAAQVRGE